MKVSRLIFTILLLCFFGTDFVYSQDGSKKDKSKTDKSAPKIVEVKANVLVLEADGKFADIKSEDLKIFEDGVEQKITYLAKKKHASNIGLVMDNTGSMRPHINKITATGTAFVNNLRPQDETFLMRFVSSDKMEIWQDWTSNKSLLNEGLANLYAEGGQSAIIDALYLAAGKMLEREKADKSNRCALILITDGEDRDSYYKLQEMLDLFKGSDVQIFTIGLTQDLSDKKNEESGGKKNAKTNAEKLLNLLALETGGAAFILGDKSKDIKNALVEALKAIFAEMSSQYIVGYVSTNQQRDGLPRKLTVQVADGANGEKRQTFIRESFIVPKDK